MIKYMPFFILLLFTTNSNAQTELVPNGSFEIISSCPEGGNQIEKAIGWFNCGETPDLCNVCNTSILGLGVPLNNFGFQYASDGVGYADLSTYSVNGYYREFIGAQLNQLLVPGNSYKVSFKCSPGTLNQYSLATNNIGVLFTTVAYSQSNPVPAKNFAHLNIDTVVTDTAIWTVLSAYWMADSAYKYIMLGNFFSDNQTDTIGTYPFDAFGYYYIDEVSVIDEGKNAIADFDDQQVYVTWQGDELMIEANGERIDEVLISDAIGSIIYRGNHSSTSCKSIRINLSNTIKGMYVIMIKSEGKQFVKKILKL
ncbi:MAG: T9SS type A sorting domain-containing protein [Chitinophagales bacterium]|nr:T9SS type A sorting domain-containing protein [Chitinophagales bacterium]